jgi:hypothetical protein
MKLTLAAVLILMLTGCAGGIPRDLQSEEKRIVVLSFMAGEYNSLENTQPSNASIQQEVDRMNAALPTMDAWQVDYSDFYAGSQMKRWTHDVVDWGIDQYAVNAVRAQLGKKYRIVDFKYDPADLDYEGDYAAFVHQSTDQIGSAIRRQAGYAGANDVDAYVVLLPAQQDFTILDRWSYGVGMTRDFLAFGEGQRIGDGVYMLHALYNVAVLDARSFELLAVEVAQHDTLYHNRFRGNPAIFVDGSYWADSYEQVTPAQREKIVARVKEMIDTTLPGTLQKLALIP